MSTAGSENSSTPFAGYTPETQAKQEEGKQKKGSKSGFYSNSRGIRFYIKRSAEYIADNVAEVITSQLLKFVIDRHAVEYFSVQNQDDHTIYVASEVSEGFESLKNYVQNHKRQKTGNPKYTLPMVGANPRDKEAIFDAIADDEEAKKGLAKILAGCLWVGEYDCQLGNILIGKNDQGKTEIRKFDNGWGLADICKPENHIVNLFGQKPFAADMGTHGFGLVPTNHFNDYPKIIRSMEFIEALGSVIEKTTPESIDKLANDVINQIVQDYPEKDQLNALKAFSKHIGLTEKLYSSNLNLEGLKNIIKISLNKRLQERADSMVVLQSLLFINASQSLASEQNRTLKLAEKISILRNFKQIIKDKCINNPRYPRNKSIQEILYDIDPSYQDVLRNFLKDMPTKDELDENERDEVEKLMQFFEALLETTVPLSQLKNPETILSTTAPAAATTPLFSKVRESSVKLFKRFRTENIDPNNPGTGDQKKKPS